MADYRMETLKYRVREFITIHPEQGIVFAEFLENCAKPLRGQWVTHINNAISDFEYYSDENTEYRKLEQERERQVEEDVIETKTLEKIKI